MAESVSDQSVLVIGAATVDMKGRPAEPLRPGTSSPGAIRTSVGGVARNIAENLVRLGITTRLLTAVGDDRSGARIRAQAAEAGIDVTHVLVVPQASTASYIALQTQRGSLAYALDDMRVMASLRSQHIYHRRRLLSEADMIVVDANLSPAALSTVFRIARQAGVPVCADPTTASLAHRFLPHLRDLLLITPNLREAEELYQSPIPEGDRDAALAAAKRLVALGAQIAVVTLAEKGLCYATNKESGLVPAVETDLVDHTGAGDALTAAVVFALLNEIPISEAMRLGCSAASLTIACDQTVVPDLSLELLYDNLAV